MILLNFRAGQGMQEHSAREIVTVYVISGYLRHSAVSRPNEPDSAKRYVPSERWNALS